MSATLDEALDALQGAGTVEVDRAAGKAEVDVVDVDRIGVRVRGVRVHRDRAVDVGEEAQRLPERLRSLPDRVAPVEVDATLGGARLRTRPDEMRGRDFFEVDVAPTRTDIHRTRIDDEGERHDADWTMTRDQLDRLLHETEG